MNKNISPQDRTDAPYSFRINSYRAIAVQKNSAVKTDLLGKLYMTTPFHPSFIVWTDDGLAAFLHAAKSDASLTRERKNWTSVLKDPSRLKAYAAHMGRIMYDSFLPNVDAPVPEIIPYMDGLAQKGYFDSNRNLIGLNFSPSSPLRDRRQADATISHELFHGIEFILRNWSAENRLAGNRPLDDAGEKFFYAFDGRLGHVADTINLQSYGASFHERAAFYVKYIVFSGDPSRLLTRSKAWLENPAVTQYGTYSENGRIPAACKPA